MIDTETHVVIVGATASIGAGVVRRFAASAALTITSGHARAATVIDGLTRALPLDLRDDCSIETFSGELARLMPRIDVALFLAGALPGKALGAYTFDEIDDVTAVNFTGQAKLLQRMLPLLGPDSRVLMLSSISAQRGSFDPIYPASKGAVLSFVKAMAAALPAGARINAVAPGLIEDSTMFHDMTGDRRELHRRQVPSGRLLDIDDLAAVLFDLCQPHWRHLNGACIDLNGGQCVR